MNTLVSVLNIFVTSCIFSLLTSVSPFLSLSHDTYCISPRWHVLTFSLYFLSLKYFAVPLFSLFLSLFLNCWYISRIASRHPPRKTFPVRYTSIHLGHRASGRARRHSSFLMSIVFRLCFEILIE